ERGPSGRSCSIGLANSVRSGSSSGVRPQSDRAGGPGPSISQLSTLNSQPVSVLVVDDDADVRQLLAIRLRGQGYEVDTAADGDEALLRVAAGQPDLIFLDISMPGRDGLAVLAELRRAELDLAVVMTTAFGSEAVA